MKTKEKALLMRKHMKIKERVFKKKCKKKKIKLKSKKMHRLGGISKKKIKKCEINENQTSMIEEE